MIVADIAHMPDGCATWPAFWTNGQRQWPYGGEFDIIEGTNGQGFNRVTLHTGSDKCILPTVFQPGMSEMTGKVARPSCLGASGCSIEDRNTKSWGKAFNDNGGGWYVMRRNPGGFAVWFFERNGNVPDSVKYGGSVIDENELGVKVADFPFWGNVSGDCDINHEFTDQQLIFNIAMGGNWAVSRWRGSGCIEKWGEDLYDVILNHPEALSEAYWLINGLRLYGADEGYAPTPDVTVGATAAPTRTTGAVTGAPPEPADEPASLPAPIPKVPEASIAVGNWGVPPPAPNPTEEAAVAVDDGGAPPPAPNVGSSEGDA